MKTVLRAIVGFWGKRSTAEKRVILIFFASMPVLGYISHLQNQVQRYRQESLNRKETLDMIMVERGVVRSEQNILSEKDLEKMAKEITQGLDVLKKELKKGQVEAVTQIRLSLESKNAVIELEPLTEVMESPEISGEWRDRGAWVPNSTMWIKDEWVQVQVKVPQFEVLSINHAPIQLDIIDHQDDDGRAQFVVARNAWTGEAIEKVEVSRSLLQGEVFDPFFSIGVGVSDEAGMFTLSRHYSSKSFFQGFVGYDFSDQAPTFGVSWNTALKWPWRR